MTWLPKSLTYLLTSHCIYLLHVAGLPTYYEKLRNIRQKYKARDESCRSLLIIHFAASRAAVSAGILNGILPCSAAYFIPRRSHSHIELCYVFQSPFARYPQPLHEGTATFLLILCSSLATPPPALPPQRPPHRLLSRSSPATAP